MSMCTCLSCSGPDHCWRGHALVLHFQPLGLLTLYLDPSLFLYAIQYGVQQQLIESTILNQ